MRIGELARQVGVTPDTVRFYERAGLLPRPPRRENDYRDYGEADAEHLRLLIDLRRLEVPLDEAAQIASWCHSGHCTQSSQALPAVIAQRRASIASRITGLQALDARLSALEAHLGSRPPMLPMAQDGACCDAASAVMDTAEGNCSCCAPVARERRTSLPGN